MRLGIIGHGAIGRALAAAAGRGELGPGVEVVAVLVRRPRAAGDGGLLTHEPARFFGARPEVVLECAGHEAVRDAWPALPGEGRGPGADLDRRAGRRRSA